MNLGQTISLAGSKYSYWWLSLLFAIGTVGLGLFLIFNPQGANAIAVTIIGISLIYDGVTNIWTESRLGKVAKAKTSDGNIEIVDTDGRIIETEQEERF